MKLLPVVLLAVVLLGGCAPKSRPPQIDRTATVEEQREQMRLVASAMLERERRLHDVAFPILVANADLCDDKVGHVLGLQLYDRESFSDQWAEAQDFIFGDSEYVQVAFAVRGGPAQAAGIRSGDAILAVNGQRYESGADACDEVCEMLDRAVAGGRPIHFLLGRSGGLVTACVVPVRSCAISMVRVDQGEVNAYTDGERIVVFSGLMKFCDDEELAVIVGHELAHAAMDHVESIQGNMMIGAIFDGLITGLTGVHCTVGQQVGMAAYSQDFEREADYIGLYMAARGGFDVSRAANLWRRMAVENPGSITHASSHPTSAERFLAIEATVKEIGELSTQGEPLWPDLGEYERERLDSAVTLSEARSQD